MLFFIPKYEIHKMQFFFSQRIVAKSRLILQRNRLIGATWTVVKLMTVPFHRRNLENAV